MGIQGNHVSKPPPPHRFSGPTSEFLVEREKTLQVDIAALKSLIAAREAELTQIREMKSGEKQNG